MLDLRPYLIALLLFVTPAVFATDWNQYRGPNRDGKSAETGLVRGWSDEGPKELWRRPIGEGFSAITAVDGRLYTLDSDEESEYALAVDAETGETLWRVPVGELFTNNYGDGPRSAPTWDEGTLYVVASTGNLVALDAASGETRWKVSFQESFDSQVPRWAFTSHPLIDGDRVVVEVGGTDGRALARFDKKTGEVVWTTYDGSIAYSSPIAIEAGGVRHYVFVTQEQVLGVDPATGSILWQSEFVPELGIKPAMPVFVEPDLVFVSASYDAGAKVVRLKATEDGVQAEDVWQDRFMRNHFNSSIALGDSLIGFDKSILKSIEAATGDLHWAQRGMGKGSLILADGMFILLSERGTLHLAEASAEEYVELASHPVLSGRCWTQPTLADGRLYLRNGDEMVALDLRR